jgi:release factor glutamine methyltransferase
MAIERLDDVRARLREDALQRGVNPRDVDLLLSDLLSQSTAWLYAHGEHELDPAPVEALLRRRYEGEPLQYVRGRTEFYSRDFLVDERVLIPRPETELLVETALERAPRNARVVDVGAGSGCIAITLSLERADLRVFSVDRSIGALAVATRNSQRLGARVSFFASDLLSSSRSTFDVVVSNPPYIPEKEYKQLDREVRIYEPRLALTPGRKGTEIIERLLAERRAPMVILEVGYGQEETVRKLAAKQRYDVDAFLPDLAGIPRIVVLSGAW